MHGLVEPGRDVVARGIPVVRDIGVVAGDDQEKAPDAVGEFDEWISGCKMDLDDHAIVALLDHERHVGPARATFIRGNDHAEAALGREGKRAALLDAKLGSENMHGASSSGWRVVVSSKASLFFP
jgi:hypothetical protein